MRRVCGFESRQGAPYLDDEVEMTDSTALRTFSVEFFNDAPETIEAESFYVNDEGVLIFTIPDPEQRYNERPVAAFSAGLWKSVRLVK